MRAPSRSSSIPIKPSRNTRRASRKQAWTCAGVLRELRSKAVNWALRNIGKRNLRLNRAAIRAAECIRRQNSRTARWIAADALRELQSAAVRARLRRRAA